MAHKNAEEDLISNRELQQLYKFYLNYLENARKLTIEESTGVSGLGLINEPILSVECNIIICILNGIVSELTIVNRGKSVSSEEKIDKTPIVESRNTFNNNLRNKIYDENTLEPIQVAMTRMIAAKFEKDMETLEKLLRNTINEIREKHSVEYLEKFINKEKNDAIQEYNLIVNYINNKKLLKNLEKGLSRSKNDLHETTIKLNNNIIEQEKQFYDTQIENNIKLRVINKWENSRHEQAKIISVNTEKQLQNQINNYKLKIEREQITIYETENFIIMKIQEIDNLKQYWAKRHETEVNELNAEIKITKDTIKEIDSKIEKLQEEFKTQETFINEYREMQRIANAKRKLEENQWNAAIKIQSWWRGVMVRKQLGPYKPKKKSKKGKGGGKDKGKKK